MKSMENSSFHDANTSDSDIDSSEDSTSIHATMLSPHYLRSADRAPSIWSPDSGYGSTENLAPFSPTPLIRACVTTLRLASVQEHDKSCLTDLQDKDEACTRCGNGRSTRAGKQGRCQSCRLHDNFEPKPISATYASLPRLQIPETTSDPFSHDHVTSSTSSPCDSSADQTPASPKQCHLAVRRSRAGRIAKLPANALTRLQAWLEANCNNPYPTAEVKRSLAQECGISEKQVTTWFTNARARQLPLDTRLDSGHNEVVADSPFGDALFTTARSPAFSRTPVVQPNGPDLRWSPLATQQSNGQISRRGKKKDYRRNANLTPQTSLGPPRSTLTANHITAIPQGTLPSAVSAAKTDANTADKWQCTFCSKQVAPKSWRRHEETQHRPRSQWTCMLSGPRLRASSRSDSTSGTCAFCDEQDPDEEHFQNNHRISVCWRKAEVDRTFLRPDHLRQHIKNYHKAELSKAAQVQWKRAAEARPQGWNCGFCGEHLVTWDQRETHIANHFKEGMTLTSWRGPLESELREGRADSILAQETEPANNTQNTLTPDRHHTIAHSVHSSPLSHVLPLSSQPCSHSIPFTTAFDTPFADHTIGLGISQSHSHPALLSDLSNLPLIDPSTSDIDWSTFPPVLDPLQHQNQQEQQQQQQQRPRIHFPMTTSALFDPALETASLQHDFDRSLNMDPYGNPIGYQGGWGQQ